MKDVLDGLDTEVQTKLEEMTHKNLARLILSEASPRIIVPNFYEWVGVGLLERDGGLKRKEYQWPE